MSRMWQKALNTYNYSVTLEDYVNASEYPGYFTFPTRINNHSSTVSFENHFRKGAPTDIEFWLEVIFWKMYSQSGRRDNRTNKVASHFKSAGISPKQLLNACSNYISNDTTSNLRTIIELLGFNSRVIAIAATFPAFLRPDLFPMVDTRIAKWVGANMQAHNNASQSGPQLVRPRYLDTQATVLTLADFEFVDSWTHWCRHKANQLTGCTSIKWRPRDVEMAVFNASGDRGKKHPVIQLEVLP